MKILWCFLALSFFDFSCCTGQVIRSAPVSVSKRFNSVNDENTRPYERILKIDSFVIRTVTDKHLAFPDVAQLPDGRFLLVYREGAGHVDSTGRIMCQQSRDGYTWTEPQVFYDDPVYDDRDPSITVMPDSTVGLVFFKYKKGIKNKTPNIHHLFFGSCRLPALKIDKVIQLDPGEMNITAAKNEGNIWKTMSGEKIKVEAASSKMIAWGNKWIIPAYGGYPLLRKDTVFTSPASRISLFISDDKGKTFIQHMVNHGEKKEVYLQEPCLLALDDTTLLMHIRTANGSPYLAGPMMQARSDDGGLTWSKWTELPVTGHAPFLFKCRECLISAFRMLNEEYTREYTAFMVSYDRGKSWSNPHIVEDCGENECGYPSIVSLSETKFLMVYYSDDGKSVKGAVFEMK